MTEHLRTSITGCLVAVFWLGAVVAAVSGDTFVEVATSSNRWTGIAVSKSGRLFVSFPRWSNNVPVSVGELGEDGTVVAYPNQELNSWKAGDNPKNKFVCVQSVFVDRKDRLWILDPASPMFSGVVPGGPKLSQFDLDSNELVRAYHFDSTAAPPQSYLNDVRIDTRSETAFITDSGLGAIVVVDLETGAVRRLLEDHPSTKAEKVEVVIGGRPFPSQIHSDGIALDEESGWLYFQALTGRTLYRVPTEALRDTSLSAEQLTRKVEPFSVSGVSDGLLCGPGGIYVSALEEDSIKRVKTSGEVETIVKDPRILWPDSFALGTDGSVYFTTSQIHLGPNPPSPYRILKLLPR